MRVMGGFFISDSFYSSGISAREANSYNWPALWIMTVLFFFTVKNMKGMKKKNTV